MTDGVGLIGIIEVIGLLVAFAIVIGVAVASLVLMIRLFTGLVKR
jgi:hypothetical protein